MASPLSTPQHSNLDLDGRVRSQMWAHVAGGLPKHLTHRHVKHDCECTRQERAEHLNNAFKGGTLLHVSLTEVLRS